MHIHEKKLLVTFIKKSPVKSCRNQTWTE